MRSDSNSTIANGTATCTITTGTANCGNAAVQPTLNAGTWTLPDGSYASVAISGTAPASIGPGRYGQLVMNGSALSLRPGVYVIESLNVGSGVVSGSEATMFVVCASTCPSAALALSGPTAITLASLVIPGVGREVTLTGQSKLSIQGPIEAPQTTLRIAGTATAHPGNAQR